MWRTDATKNGAAFVRFLDYLAAAFPDGPGVVVVSVQSAWLGESSDGRAVPWSAASTAATRKPSSDRLC